MIAKNRFTPAQARAWQALVLCVLDDGKMLRIVSQYLEPKAAAAALYQAARAQRPKPGASAPLLDQCSNARSTSPRSKLGRPRAASR